MIDYDISYEKDQLDRADGPPATCPHGYIPVDGEPCPDCDPREATFLRLVAGGCSRREAAEIVDAGFMDFGQHQEHYEKVA